MEEKKPWYKRPFLVMSLILIGLIVVIQIAISISPDDTDTTNAVAKSSSSDDDYDTEDDPYDDESDVSSDEYSSTSDFSTDSKTSLANLKADVSTMPKENYDNIENDILSKADFDPTGNNPSASYQIDAINNAMKNVQKLADDAKSLSDKHDSDYTQDDKNKLTNYSNVLSDYLSSLKDYANIIYMDKYTSEDPTTSQSDKQLLVDEMNQYKNTFSEKKNEWLNQYNSILGQQ